MSTPTRAPERKDLDSLIETLVADRSASKSTGTSSPTGPKSRPSSTINPGQVGVDIDDHAVSEPRSAAQTASAGTQTWSSTPVQTNVDSSPAPTRPRPHVETYEKGVQTSEPWSPQRRRKPSDSVSDSEREQSPSKGRSPKVKRLSRRGREREDELRQNIRKELEEELKAVSNLSIDDRLPTRSSQYPARELTDEEVNAVTASEDFLEFVERSSKVIEKALDQDYDVLVDYGLDGIGGIEEDEDEGYASSKGKKGRRIKQISQFYDERWSKNRMISDMNFSPKVGNHCRLLGRSNLYSFLNCFWHHTLRIRRLLKILLACSKFGTSIFTPVQNTSFTIHPIS